MPSSAPLQDHQDEERGIAPERIVRGADLGRVPTYAHCGRRLSEFAITMATARGSAERMA